MITTTFYIFFGLVFLLVLSFILNKILEKILTGKKYHYFLIPGIMVHELSHALACRLAGAKIREINFLSKNGGYVKYNSPKIPILGELLINFAPILGGAGILLFFFWLLNLDYRQPNLLSWQFWLFTYLAISIIICLTPSKQDLKNSLTGILIIFILLLIIYFLGFFF